MNIVRSEVRKALSSRSTYGIAAVMVAFAAMSVLQTIGASGGEAGKPVTDRQFFFLTSMQARLFGALIGIKLVTDEFRYGTIVPTLLAGPRRLNLATAKVGVAAATGLLSGAVTTAVIAAIALPRMAAEAAPHALGWGDARALAGLAVAAAVWSVLGASLALVVRHQLAAFAIAVVWVMFAEEIIGPRIEKFAVLLPGGATAAAIAAPARVALPAAFAVLAWVVLAGAGSALRFWRADV